MRLDYLCLGHTPDEETWNDPDRPNVCHAVASFKRFEFLQKLSVPKSALFAYFTHEQDRGLLPQRSHQTLTDILPLSVEEIEIFCEYEKFTAEDIAVLRNPGPEHLQNVTIFNCFLKTLISTRDGEGSAHEATIMKNKLKHLEPYFNLVRTRHNHFLDNVAIGTPQEKQLFCNYGTGDEETDSD